MQIGNKNTPIKPVIISWHNNCDIEIMRSCLAATKALMTMIAEISGFSPIT